MSFKKWGIYHANLEPVIGSEQGKSRPVIIISEDEINQLLNVVNVLPITTRKGGRKIYPNEALLEADRFGLPNESIVLCYQIRTLDKYRLGKLYGEIINEEKQSEILNALCFQLGINITPGPSR
jgi:mRNA interferase MazF